MQNYKCKFKFYGVVLLVFQLFWFVAYPYFLDQNGYNNYGNSHAMYQIFNGLSILFIAMNINLGYQIILKTEMETQYVVKIQ